MAGIESTLPVHKTLGTHNLLDGKGEAIAFAAIILWTEITSKIFSDRVAKKHRIWRCGLQRDLAISVDRRIAAHMTRVVKHYRFVVPGWAKVTPHRGVFWITFRLDGEKCAILVEHRINAWYEPWIRGERSFRTYWWHKQTSISNRIQKRLIKRGFRIIAAGGDANAPENVLAYPLLNETYDMHLDRVASTDSLRSWRAMGNGGSDHRRVIAWRAA